MRRPTSLLLFLCIACAAALLAAPVGLADSGSGDGSRTPSGSCRPHESWAAARQSAAKRVVELVNAHRASKGLPRLRTSKPLTAAAEWKARHMATFGYFDHSDQLKPRPRSAAARIAACGWPRTARWGENIAMGQRTAREVLRAWLRSPGHRRNIERRSFTKIGVGVARDENGTPYWTQIFGSN